MGSTKLARKKGIGKHGSDIMSGTKLSLQSVCAATMNDMNDIIADDMKARSAFEASMKQLAAFGHSVR